MEFLSAGRLWPLLSVPALVTASVAMQQRRAQRFTQHGLDRIAPHEPRWRRYKSVVLALG